MNAVERANLFLYNLCLVPYLFVCLVFLVMASSSSYSCCLIFLSVCVCVCFYHVYILLYSIFGNTVIIASGCISLKYLLLLLSRII